jgi:hypothetical protein
MGYSLSWAARRNGTLETICSSCGLRATGKREETPESNIVSAEIPSGWQVVLYNRSEVDNQVLARLSAEGEVVSCFVEDHVMFSSASGWEHGNQVWRVFHDCEKGRYHLEIAGTPPAALAEIQKRLTEKQDAAGGERADVGYICDIPAELAKALTSFRHDEDIQDADGDVYKVLESTSTIARLTSIFRGSKKSSVIVLLFFAIVFSPVLLVAALIAVPLIGAQRLVRKFRGKRIHA